MIPPSGKNWHGNEPKNLATTEHIYNKRDLRRLLNNKIVMACFNCNQKKGVQDNDFYKSFFEQQPIMDIRKFLRYANKRNKQ